MMTTKIGGIEKKQQWTDVAHRMWKLNAVDGDGNIITVRLDSTLNSEGKLLTPGAVIHITSAFAIYMNYGDLYDMRCAIVIRAFRIVERCTVPEGLSGPPAESSKRLLCSIQDTLYTHLKCPIGWLLMSGEMSISNKH